MNFNDNLNPSPEKINVEVKIGNIKYNLTTTESEEYINGIAKYINNKIDELSVSHKNLNINSIPFFITMALNIADDLFKQRKQFTKSSKSLKSLEESYSKLNENNLYAENLKIKLEEKEAEIISLKEEIKNISTQKDNEIETLKQDYLSIINSKDNEINSLNEKINISNNEIVSLTEQIANLNDEVNLLTEKTSNSNDEIISLSKEISSLNETINSLNKKIEEFSSLEDESLNLLYEKDKEITNLNKKIEELSFRLNISNES